MKDIYFSVQTKLNTIVSTTIDYWEYIVTYKHNVMRGKENLVRDTLSDPSSIKYSKKDRDVVLYYYRVR